MQRPETEVEANIVFGDFLALLDRQERQVVVLLQSGITKVGDVVSILGHKNHSPVSKPGSTDDIEGWQPFPQVRPRFPFPGGCTYQVRS